MSEPRVLTFEYDLFQAGAAAAIAGVDEAGRGCLAGPVTAAAVILKREFSVPGIDDSKKLSPRKREKLFELIAENSLAMSVAFVDNETIDKINILNAAMLAMKRAIEKLDVRPNFALVDGNRLPSINVPAKAIIGGDAKSLSIAAASIAAKVSRDKWMIEVADKLYPRYGFASHKGYAAKSHFAALDKYGECPLHRKSFLRKYYARKNSLF